MPINCPGSGTGPIDIKPSPERHLFNTLTKAPTPYIETDASAQAERLARIDDVGAGIAAARARLDLGL